MTLLGKNRHLLPLLLAATATVCALPPATAVNDWPQFMYDVTHQGAVPLNENSEFGVFKQRWWNNVSINQPVTVRGSSVVYGGRVYVAASDGFIYAFDTENGGLIWKNDTGGPASSTPVVAGGYVYVVSESGMLRAYSAATGLKRPFAPEVSVGATRGSPAIHEQLLVIGTSSGTISAYLVDTFQLLWSYATTDTLDTTQDPPVQKCGQAPNAAPIDATPAIHAGRIMFGSTNGFFYSLPEVTAAQGSLTAKDLQWCFHTGGAIRASAAVDRLNQRVIVGSENGKIYSLPFTGTGTVTAAWTYQETSFGNPSQIKSSASIWNNKVFFGAKSGNLTALDLLTGAPSGKPLWVKPTGGEIVSSPSVANGHVIFGSKDRNVYMLKESDGTVEWQQPMSGEVESSPAIAGSQAFWTTIDGSLNSWGGKKPDRADLAITSVTASSPFYATQAGSITVELKNQGVLAAPATMARLFVGSQVLPETQVPALQPNQTHTFTVSYTPPTPGTFQLRIFLDAFVQVLESDESNNQRTLPITVGDAPPASPVIPEPPSSSEGGIPGLHGAETFALVALTSLLLRVRRKRPE